MLFIEPRYGAKSVKDYFTQHLSRDDYFTHGKQAAVIGKAEGRGADLLGMKPDVDREAYFRLIDNQHPVTGERLTARNVKGAKVANEFTADMPKSATLADQLGGDRQVWADFDKALDETMEEAESEMRCYVRKGGQSSTRVTANMVRIKFAHRVTRDLDDGTSDPHNHVHVVVPNRTYDPVEKQWKACEIEPIKSEALYYQAALHARMTKRLADRGYAIEQDGKSFRILGIDRALVDKFSRRTRDIKAEEERLGITDPKAKAQIGRRLRNAKKDEPKTLEELQAEWKARCTPEELNALRNARHRGLTGNRATPKQSVDYAIAHCFYDQAVVSEKRLAAEALMQGVGSVTPEQVWAEIRTRKELIHQTKEGRRYVTTQEWRIAEQKLVGFVREGRGTCKKLGGGRAELDPSLDEEQRKAAQAILASRDRVIALRGAAGAGKTYMMYAVRDVLEKRGQWGGAYAVSTQASRINLRESGFADADTIAKLRSDENLQAKLAGKVVFIDEVGLMPVKEMNEVFNLAKQHNWRLIIAGDTKQHGPVQGPSALKLIEQESGLPFAELLDNKRQLDAQYRSAVNDTRQGNELTEDGKTTYLERAIQTLDAQGRIVELPANQLYAKAAQDYLDIGVSAKGKPETKLLVTTTHAESDAVVADIRAGLRDTGQITGEDHSVPSLRTLNWSPAKRGQALAYEPGLVVQFNQNARGIKRGERFTVTGRENGKVTIARANGKTLDLPLHRAEDFEVYRKGAMTVAAGDLIRPTKNGQTQPVMRGGEKTRSKINNGDTYKVSGFLANGDIVCSNGFVVPKDYGHLRPGDTLTSMSSQSKTKDHLLTVITEKSMVAANLEQLYVTLSRGRKSATIYTDNKEALIHAVKHSSGRMSATELLKTPATQVAKERSGWLEQIREKARIRQRYEAIRKRGRQAIGRIRNAREQGHERRRA